MTESKTDKYSQLKETEEAFLSHVVDSLNDERKRELMDNIQHHRHRVATVLRYCHLTDEEEQKFLVALTDDEKQRYIINIKYNKYLEKIRNDDPSYIENYELTEEDKALLEKGKIKGHLLVAAIKELFKTV